MHNKEHKLFTKISNFSVDDSGIIEGYVTTYGTKKAMKFLRTAMALPLNLIWKKTL